MAKMTHADKDALIQELEDMNEALRSERDELESVAKEVKEAYFAIRDAMPSFRTIGRALRDLGVAFVNLFRADKK